MADDEKAAAQASQRRSAQADNEPVKYPVDRLEANAQAYFDVDPGFFAGALVAAKVRKQSLTMDEAKEAVAAYKDHEVEVNDPTSTTDDEG